MLFISCGKNVRQLTTFMFPCYHLQVLQEQPLGSEESAALRLKTIAVMYRYTTCRAVAGGMKNSEKTKYSNVNLGLID